MVKLFAQYLKGKGGLTPLEFDAFEKVSPIKTILKNQNILEKRDVSNFIGFVAKDSFRRSCISGDGQENIMSLPLRTCGSLILPAL